MSYSLYIAFDAPDWQAELEVLEQWVDAGYADEIGLDRPFIDPHVRWAETQAKKD